MLAPVIVVLAMLLPAIVAAAMLVPVIVVAAISAPVTVASVIFKEVTALSASFVPSTALALIFAVVIALLVIVITPPVSVASPDNAVAVLVAPSPVNICPLLKVGVAPTPASSAAGTQFVPFHFKTWPEVAADCASLSAVIVVAAMLAPVMVVLAMLLPAIVEAAMSAPVTEASVIFKEVTALSASFAPSTALALIFAVVIALLVIVITPPVSVASPDSTVAELVAPSPVNICPLFNVGVAPTPASSAAGTQFVPFHFKTWPEVAADCASLSAVIVVAAILAPVIVVL